MFQEFDVDGSGSIDYLELEQLLNVICDRGRSGVHLDEPFSTDDVQVVMSSFDTDGSGTVEETEFVALFHLLPTLKLLVVFFVITAAAAAANVLECRRVVGLR